MTARVGLDYGNGEVIFLEAWTIPTPESTIRRCIDKKPLATQPKFLTEIAHADRGGEEDEHGL